MTKTITIAYGDDISAHLIQNTLKILQRAQVKVNFDFIEIGQNIFDKGFKPGLMPSAFDNINNSKILIKGPINNENILNQTLIKTLNLNTNIEEIKRAKPLSDIALIHGNENIFLKPSYYHQSANFIQNISFINRQQYQHSIHHSFCYAIKNNRHKISYVTSESDCLYKDFYSDFCNIAKNYPSIKTRTLSFDEIINEISTKPQNLDVIFTSQIQANIISKLITKANIRSVTNLNDEYIICDINQQQDCEISKQASLINSSSIILSQINEFLAAKNIKNALLKTIEDSNNNNCDEFIDKIISNLGQNPRIFAIANYEEYQKSAISNEETITPTLIGFDLFINWQQDFSELINNLNKLESEIFEIKTISQNNQLLWPLADTHLRPKIQNSPLVLRFIGKNITKASSIDIIDSTKSITQQQIVEILQIFSKKPFDFIKFEGLYQLNSKAQYLANQGEQNSNE